MPPRKKARHSQATSPSPSASRQKTPETAPSQLSASSPNKAPERTPDDLWSDHEEIGLFKGLMVYKPTGIHKHFRLLALHSWLLDNNYIHPRNEHTKPRGIRAKLDTLYNMDALDAREDARQLPAMDLPDSEMSDAKGTVLDDDIYSEADNRIEQDDFTLPPEEGFEKEMWQRRLPVKRADEDSDLELPELNLAEEPPVRFVATVSIEPSDNAPSGSRRGRGGAAGGRRKSVPKAAGATRRSARQAESTADEEDGAAEEEEKEEGEDEEEEEGEDSESEDQSQASTPAPRATRTKGTRRRPRGRGGAAPGRKRATRNG